MAPRVQVPAEVDQAARGPEARELPCRDVERVTLGDPPEIDLDPRIVESNRVRLQVVSSPAPTLLSEPAIDLVAGAADGALPDEWNNPWLLDFVNELGQSAEPLPQDLIVTVP